MNTHAVKVIAISILAVFLTACGGGSSGGGSGGDVPLSTSDIRMFQAGDSTTFNLALKEQDGTLVSNNAITRTVISTVTNPYGIECKVVEMTGTVSFPNDSVSMRERWLMYQDADGSVYECGDYIFEVAAYNFLQNTSSHPNGIRLIQKSPMQVGQIITGIATYDDGTWEDCTYNVTGTEYIAAAGKRYETYRLSASCVNSSGEVYNSSEWIRPDIDLMKASSIEYGLLWEITMESFSPR